jgi:hypothetical protein
MRGQFRIQTEADVVRHNATEVMEVAPPVYVWRIDGVEQPSPQLILSARR